MKFIFFVTCIFVLIVEYHGFDFSIGFKNKEHTIFMYDEIYLEFNITDNTKGEKYTGNVSLEVTVDKKEIANFYNDKSKTNLSLSMENGYVEGKVPVEGLFLGRAKISFALKEPENKKLNSTDVIVIRAPRVIDKVFTGCVATFVALIYINFGCALNWSSLKTILRRPIGPCIGFVGQFVVMPTLAFVVGLLVFPDHPDMRLGMLFAGVSPAGGASNVWTVLLDGNVDLSVTMTTISTLAAFGMMPLWLFTLGPKVFADAKIGVPYQHIASLAGALIIPLFIGWLIQRFFPKLSQLLVRILKGFSALLIIFIVAFAIATNLYLFQLATWQIAVAGLLLPWCGYVFGGLLALLFRQPSKDVLAISIETGVQNTGIAIFLLRFALPQPQADLTTVVPVAIAVMTPVPLTILFIYRRFFRKTNSKIPLEELQSSDRIDVR